MPKMYRPSDSKSSTAGLVSGESRSKTSLPKGLPKACVIMRFGTEGSEEHAHFRGVYHNFIKPAVEEAGYECVRADEMYRPGQILSDVLHMIFTSDICVVDLTTANPNVFYELAIRQLARPAGTILIRDNNRIPDSIVPFDVSSLRVHSYEVTAAKAPELRITLLEAIESIRLGNRTTSDNHIYEPFHDFLRTWAGLPRGIRVPPGADSTSALTPWQTVLKAEEDANSDRLPKRIIGRAHEIVKRRTSVYGENDDGTITEFVECVKEFFQTSVFEPSPAEFLELHHLASRLDTRALADSILEEGLRKYPKNRRLTGRRLDRLAHSDKLEILESTKTELTNELKLAPGSVDMTYARDRVDLLGLLLDVYLRQGEYDQALQIVTELKKSQEGQEGPTPFILRNYARALQRSARASNDAIIQAYKEAVLHPDEDDVAASWCANFLREQKRPIDALELTALACLRDSEYAEHFAFLAYDLSVALHPKRSLKSKSYERVLPKDCIGPDDVIKAILMAQSCSNYDVSDQESCELAMTRADLDIDEVKEHARNEQRREYAQFEREDYIADLYLKLRSDLTENSDER